MEGLIQVSIESKKMAEVFFDQRNMEEARCFAIKAYMLNPKLDGISDLAAALEVIVCAERQVRAARAENGKISKKFYRKVIGLQPNCDYDTTRSQFKKLAYAVHPDRNRSVAALTAFTIINEAWSHLCHPKKPKHEETSGNNALGNYSPAPPARAGPTFWTVCSECSTQYEYSVDLRRKHVRCVRCCGHFLAVEIPIPPPLSDQNAGGILTVGRIGFTSPVSSVKTAPAGRNVVKDRREWKMKLGKQGSYATKPGYIHVTEQNKALIPVSELVNEFDSPMPLTNGRKALPKGNGNVRLVPEDVSEFKMQVEDRLPVWKPAFAESTRSGSKSDDKLTRALPRLDARRVLEKKAKKAIHQRIGENRGADPTAKQSLKRPRQLELAQAITPQKIQALTTSKVNLIRTGTEPEPIMMSVPDPDLDKKVICQKIAQNGIPDPTAKPSLRRPKQYKLTKEKTGCKKQALTVSKVNPTPTGPQPSLISVPDPDFHDFDTDRTGSAFDVNQVWAAYDPEDGMPRLYAQIHYVISRDPLNMIVSWLFPNTNGDVAFANRTNSGVPKITAGELRAGKPEANRGLISFSHKVVWMRDSRENILIYPGKGEVWALYKNWSPSWNASTAKEVIREYYFVEVLGKFKRNFGVRVFPLTKVPGFKSVFRRVRDEKHIKTIPEEEISRFSHQAPARWLKGNEGRNAPKDCWDIDPAACPSELLRVIPIYDLTEEDDDKADVAMENASQVIKGGECNVYRRRR